MKSKLMFFSQQNQKRARSAAKRLGSIFREYQRDPAANFSARSEAAALAVRASYHLRQSEMAGRIILTDHGDRRQILLPAVG